MMWFVCGLAVGLLILLAGFLWLLAPDALTRRMQGGNSQGDRADVLTPVRWTLATRKRQVFWGWWMVAGGLVCLWLSVLGLAVQQSS